MVDFKSIRQAIIMYESRHLTIVVDPHSRSLPFPSPLQKARSYTPHVPPLLVSIFRAC